jgi:hypothetical protein
MSNFDKEESKMKVSTVLMVLTVLIALFVPALAQDKKDAMPAGMPQMGVPEEMKQVAYLIGNWDFTMKMKMNPADTFWMDSKGTAKYEPIFGGAALLSTSEQQMMGSPFYGGSLMCYDRETKMWQMTWTDNMSARISTYNGKRVGKEVVYTGEELMMGQKYLSRMTISNETPTSYDFKGESSMDGGKTWFTSMTAKYTKRK